MIKSREGILLEGDMEEDAKEVGSGEGDMEVEGVDCETVQ